MKAWSEQGFAGVMLFFWRAVRTRVSILFLGVKVPCFSNGWTGLSARDRAGKVNVISKAEITAFMIKKRFTGYRVEPMFLRHFLIHHH